MPISDDQIDVLPADIPAEQAILGAILLDNDVFDQIDEVLKGDEFFLAKHRKIFEVMRELYDEGQPIDPVTITSKLGDELGSIGGIGYLTNLAGSVPTAANVMHYVGIVKDKFVHRTAILELRKQLSKAMKAENAAGIIAELQSTAGQLADQVAPKKEFLTIQDAMRERFEIIEKRYTNRSENSVTGIPSGFPDLDRMTSGFQRQDLIIVAARPSVGKTAFALNIAQGAGKQISEAIAVFSLEMSAGQLVERMISAEGNVDASRLRTGYLEDADWERMTTAIGRMGETNIVIDDSGTITVQEIAGKCRRLKKERGLGLVIIDYLQLIQPRTRRQNRQEEVAEISRGLKQMARELDVPVIALSQLSRGVEQRQDKRPMMSDLRESGSIEQDADVVAFLYREDYYQQDTDKKNIVEIIVAKQRNGPVGTVELVFLKNFNKFVSLDRGHEQSAPRREPDPRRRWA
jgi:replicative DNA helicase